MATCGKQKRDGPQLWRCADGKRRRPQHRGAGRAGLPPGKHGRKRIPGMPDLLRRCTRSRTARKDAGRSDSAGPSPRSSVQGTRSGSAGSAPGCVPAAADGGSAPADFAAFSSACRARRAAICACRRLNSASRRAARSSISCSRCCTLSGGILGLPGGISDSPQRLVPSGSPCSRGRRSSPPAAGGCIGGWRFSPLRLPACKSPLFRSFPVSARRQSAGALNHLPVLGPDPFPGFPPVGQT